MRSPRSMKKRRASTSATALSVLALGAVVAVSRHSDPQGAGGPATPLTQDTAASDPQAAQVPDTACVREEAAKVGGTSRALRRGSKLVVVLGIIVALLAGVGAGTAWSYIRNASGQGAGTVTAGTPVAVTINAVSETDLVPGGTVAAFFTLTNTNLVSVSFTSVTSVSVASSSPTTCPSSNIITPSPLPYAISPVTVGAGTTSGTQSIANFLTLSSSAPSACQGVTFTLTLGLSGQTS